MRRITTMDTPRKAGAEQSAGACACRAVRFEIDLPARWAFHDHGTASRLAQGCAYVTYVGAYRSRFRLLEGEDQLAGWEDEAQGVRRTFCRRCGTPLFYERRTAPTMINIPRALFEERTGREPRYHLRFDERPDWAWDGGALAPLKGYPGVLWERPRRRRRGP
jgi:hypothetical protein